MREKKKSYLVNGFVAIKSKPPVNNKHMPKDMKHIQPCPNQQQQQKHNQN